MNFKTYLVGGAVRDILLGISCKDVDYVVLAPSFEAMRDNLVNEQRCKIFVEKPEFLTIRCKHPVLGCVDFACARKDGNYSDGRHPDAVEVADTLEQDLSRRDFTCNAIAKSVETGELFDPFNGEEDIRNGLLRAVRDAVTRISEDRLRAFRAVRFAVTKKFRIDRDLWEAINRQTPMDFDAVSTERIYEELVKMFRADVERSFRLLTVDFPVLWDAVRQRGIWLKPTIES